STPSSGKFGAVRLDELGNAQNTSGETPFSVQHPAYIAESPCVVVDVGGNPLLKSAGLGVVREPKTLHDTRATEPRVGVPAITQDEMLTTGEHLRLLEQIG